MNPQKANVKQTCGRGGRGGRRGRRGGRGHGARQYRRYEDDPAYRGSQSTRSTNQPISNQFIRQMGEFFIGYVH